MLLTATLSLGLVLTTSTSTQAPLTPALSPEGRGEVLALALAPTSAPTSTSASAPAPAPAPAKPAVAAPISPQVKPEPREKCPVCGMIVARFPDWVAGAEFGDGSRALFDGAKDLFKFLMRFEDYGPQARRGEPRTLYVTDYYSLKQVDARAAHYVVGSDVLGPMGQELVPFARLEEARGFLADHHGTRILGFDEVTPAVVKSLDREG